MIGIHCIHREMAKVAAMNMDKEGHMIVGMPEIRLILDLVLKNYELVYNLDKLKELSFHAYEMGDTEWQQDLCRRIDELEVAMI